MNQQDVVNAIVEASRGAGKREVTQLQVRFVLQAQRDVTLSYLRENMSNSVLLTGFGVFVIQRKKARRYQDVRTRAWHTVPARATVALKIKPSLRRAI